VIDEKPLQKGRYAQCLSYLTGFRGNGALFVFTLV